MSVKNIAISKAVSLLKAAGVKYAVVLEDGTTLGELRVSAPTRIKNRGVSAYVEEIIKGLRPVDGANSVVVPYTAEFGAVAIQGAAASTANKLWGAGSTLTHRNGDGVEVLRVS